MIFQMNDHMWHHAAWVYDGTMLKLYIDGVKQSESLIAGKTNVYVVVNTPTAVCVNVLLATKLIISIHAMDTCKVIGYAYI